MIYLLQGTIMHVDENFVCLCTHSAQVGYKVIVNHIKRYKLYQNMSLWIYTKVREDAIQLYGFETLEERDLMGKLVSAPGVGPSIAMRLLAELPLEVIINAIKEKDTRHLEIKGVGYKIAQKIIDKLHKKLIATSVSEMNDKLPESKTPEKPLNAYKYCESGKHWHVLGASYNCGKLKEDDLNTANSS